MNAMLPTWSFLDSIYYMCTRLEYIDKKENIFRVRLMKYRGKSLCLSDQTVIHNNDVMLKIHLHNCLLMRELQEITGQVKRAFYVYDRVQESLPGLAEFIYNHAERDFIKGIVGITLLHRGIHRLGFEALEIPNPLYKCFKKSYLVPMFYFLHRGGIISNKEKLDPKFLVMSKQTLLERYL